MDTNAAITAELYEALRQLLDHAVLADAPDDDPTILRARAALAKAPSHTTAAA